ncbi:MAG: hypothetical protein NWQ42_00215 [Alishewanella sp.]|nr:hypothetical protein [Alishewanella sp.]MDP5034523.1 hypothetical protein [Alishewanella sp.]MDP5185777.1 hypothetical protein [Alishewanella sp.]
MNRTLATILIIAIGIYCLPTLLAILATVFAVIMGVIGAIIGIGVSLAVTVLPLLILGYLVWWLVRDKRQPHSS